jgi:hypothetical protein
MIRMEDIMNSTGEACANCGRQIGKLETPCVWNDSIVCSKCRALLENAVETAPTMRNGATPRLPVSGLGIASLALGICSVPLAMIPLIGAIALVPLGTGVIIGFFALLAAIRRKCAPAFPVAGMTVCVVGMLLVAFWAGVMFMPGALAKAHKLAATAQNAATPGDPPEVGDPHGVFVHHQIHFSVLTGHQVPTVRNGPVQKPAAAAIPPRSGWLTR